MPHYFIEYDILDLDKQEFLSTPRRQQLLQKLPIISVPILYSGKLDQLQQIDDFIGSSNYITNNHLHALKISCQQLNLDPIRALKETDHSN